MWYTFSVRLQALPLSREWELCWSVTQLWGSASHTPVLILAGSNTIFFFFLVEFMTILGCSYNANVYFLSDSRAFLVIGLHELPSLQDFCCFSPESTLQMGIFCIFSVLPDKSIQLSSILSWGIPVCEKSHEQVSNDNQCDDSIYILHSHLSGHWYKLTHEFSCVPSRVSFKERWGTLWKRISVLMLSDGNDNSDAPCWCI